MQVFFCLFNIKYCLLKRNCICLSTEKLYDFVTDCDAYLAAGQVQGSVPVLIQQCQVSLGPVKKDG